MKILIVEDEPELLKSIKSYLTQNNFLCDAANNIRDARDSILESEYNCVILYITFPVGSGFEILRQIKEIKKNCGVLIISAKDSLDDKLLGLELGADDYMTKPFHFPELAARLHAIDRRKSFDGNDLLIIDKLVVNVQDKYVKTDTGSIELTRKEFDLLLYFISNKNKVVTKQSIIDYLWGDQADMTDNYDLIYVHIKNLRMTLVDKGCPDYISAIYGIGYRFSIQTQVPGI